MPIEIEPGLTLKKLDDHSGRLFLVTAPIGDVPEVAIWFPAKEMLQAMLKLMDFAPGERYAALASPAPGEELPFRPMPQEPI
jgi:hypothetical protein